MIKIVNKQSKSDNRGVIISIGIMTIIFLNIGVVINKTMESLNDRIVFLINISLVVVYFSVIILIYNVYNKNKQLEQIAFFDMLTGLPNRESLMIELKKDSSVDSKAIMVIKLSNLNLLNRGFGYDIGDKVMIELSNRVRTLETENITLYRFVADKFVLYMEDYDGKEDKFYILEEIEILFNKPFVIDNVGQYIYLRIGVVNCNKDCKPADMLLADATIALNYTEANKIVSYAFFNDEMEEKLKRENIIERALRGAIRNKDRSKIYFHYQPLIDAKTEKIVGFEALSRMNSDYLGSISPVEFIPIAEKKQLIIPFTNFILEIATEFCAKLINMGHDYIYISINISAIHLLEDDFTSTILGAINKSEIKGCNIALEITETTLFKNYEQVNQRLSQLRSHGIRIAIDDFGTGYSSFSRLKNLNIDVLKIDREFIMDITEDNQEEVLTKEIISIAHKLNTKTVAEGVELNVQKDYLMKHNCDIIQGYLYSKPVPMEEAVELLVKYNGGELNI